MKKMTIHPFCCSGDERIKSFVKKEVVFIENKKETS